MLHQVAGDVCLLAFLRGVPAQQAPGHNQRARSGDTDQRHDPQPLPQPAAVDSVDVAPHQVVLVERGHACLLHPLPGCCLDPPECIPERVRMAGQGLLLPPGGVAMAAIAPFPDLHRCPPQM